MCMRQSKLEQGKKGLKLLLNIGKHTGGTNYARSPQLIRSAGKDGNYIQSVTWVRRPTIRGWADTIFSIRSDTDEHCRYHSPVLWLQRLRKCPVNSRIFSRLSIFSIYVVSNICYWYRSTLARSNGLVYKGRVQLIWILARYRSLYSSKFSQ